MTATGNHTRAGVPYFEKLDVVRFFSAILVVIYHAHQKWVANWHQLKIFTVNGDQQNLNAVGKAVHTGIMNGSFGVEVFFLISGFLITYLLLKEKAASGGVNIFKFYIRRTLRIWPLYYFIILISPLLINLVGQTYSPNYMANIFFYNNFDTMVNHYWVFPLAHFWSLCIEEHFYLVWPLIIAFVPLRHLNKVFVFLICLSVFYRAYLFLYTNEPWYPLFLSTFSRFDVLVIGAILGLAHSRNPIRLNFSVMTRLSVYAVFLFFYCIDNVVVWDSLFAACFKKYFYISVATFAVLNFLFNEKPLMEFLDNKVIRYFGKVSFGIYMYGLIVLEIITEVIMKPNGINNLYFYWMCVFLFSIGVPIISYELFEKQVLKLKKRFEVVRQVHTEAEKPGSQELVFSESEAIPPN